MQLSDHLFNSQNDKTDTKEIYQKCQVFRQLCLNSLAEVNGRSRAVAPQHFGCVYLGKNSFNLIINH